MAKTRQAIVRKLLILAVAGLGLAVPAPASADFLEFTVDNTNYADFGFPFHVGRFDADRIVGGYEETFTVTGPGTFTTDAFYEVGQFELDGRDVPGLTSQEGVSYQLYAVFTSDGTFSGSPSSGFVFTGTSGSVSLYVDPDFNTGLETPDNAATGDVTRTNFGDDELLATAILESGEGRLIAGSTSEDNGSFSLIFNPFLLTPDGEEYFVEPSPFYIEVLLEGQFNNFAPGAPGTSEIITGSADASFQAVPEPVTLGLFGMSLLGTGIVARRRRRNAAK